MSPFDDLERFGRTLAERATATRPPVAELQRRARRLQRRRRVLAPVAMTLVLAGATTTVAAWPERERAPQTVETQGRRPRPPRPTTTVHHHPTTSAVPTTPSTTVAPTTTATTPTTAAPSTTAPPAPTTVAPSGGDVAGGPVDPDILGTCPAAAHDRYVVRGPDGRTYRTWHPQEVLLDAANPAAGSCRFAHEHGDDPTNSVADPSLPAFGYVNALAAHDEAHQGFKVFVANKGTTNNEGRDARTSTRIVFHMGTGGVKRFTMPHHSLEFDLVADDGHAVHVMGLADTRQMGSICQRDERSSDGDPSNDVGRTVVFAKGNGCDLGSLYEIWSMDLRVGDKATIIVSTAVFDPITLFDPANPSAVVLTSSQYGGTQRGCDREAYHGPVYWYNASGPTEYRTDAFGNVTADGPLVQSVSRHADIGIPMSPDQTQFKQLSDSCAPGLGPKN